MCRSILSTLATHATAAPLPHGSLPSQGQLPWLALSPSASQQALQLCGQPALTILQVPAGLSPGVAQLKLMNATAAVKLGAVGVSGRLPSLHDELQMIIQ